MCCNRSDEQQHTAGYESDIEAATMSAQQTARRLCATPLAQLATIDSAICWHLAAKLRQAAAIPADTQPRGRHIHTYYDNNDTSVNGESSSGDDEGMHLYLQDKNDQKRPCMLL